MLALDLGDLIAGLDVNPVIVGTQGCVAVDALVIPRGAAREATPRRTARTELGSGTVPAGQPG